MATASDITDDQIRELRDSVFTFGRDADTIRRACSCALGDPSYYASAMTAARERCAVALDARSRGVKKWWRV